MLFERDKSTDLARNIRVRLPWACPPGLMSHYVALASRRGRNTTREDAFSVWMEWLDALGGKPENELTPDSWPADDHAKVAAAIREAARYV